MRKVVATCPAKGCGRPIAKDVYLRSESSLTIRCFHCGSIVQMIGTPDRVITKVIKAVEKPELTDDENCDMVVLSI